MSEIQFEEDKELATYEKKSYYRDRVEETPFLVRLLMKTGMQGRTAYYILFGILIICMFVTFQVIREAFFPNNSRQTYREDIPPEVLRTLPPEVVKQIPSRNAQK